jgi:hypothetical protein
MENSWEKLAVKTKVNGDQFNHRVVGVSKAAQYQTSKAGENRFSRTTPHNVAFKIFIHFRKSEPNLLSPLGDPIERQPSRALSSTEVLSKAPQGKNPAALFFASRLLDTQ